LDAWRFSPQLHLPLGTLLNQNKERHVMEFWLDKSKIAYTTKSIGTGSCALDVWEENSLHGLPFKYTASFMIETDARFYLTAKYPDAIEKIIAEKIINADEAATPSASLPRPTPPHDLRDDDAWRKYRLDSRRFREANSVDAA
jgi:hypothetical protein